jgi:hypothetical protein
MKIVKSVIYRKHQKTSEKTSVFDIFHNPGDRSMVTISHPEVVSKQKDIDMLKTIETFVGKAFFKNPADKDLLKSFESLFLGMSEPESVSIEDWNNFFLDSLGEEGGEGHLDEKQ